VKFFDKKDLALTTLVQIHIITLGLYWLRAQKEICKKKHFTFEMFIF